MTRSPARRAAAAACAALLACASGCLADDPALRGPFAEAPEGAMPEPAPMPKAESPGLPGSGPSSRPREADDADPCAVDEVTLAACLPEVTALAAVRPGEGAAATADGALWRIRPGAPPERVAEGGARVRQLLAMPDSAETGQVMVLRDDASVARLTLLPGGGADLAEREPEPGAVAMHVGRDGEPAFLLAGDEGIEVVGVCAVPPDAPPLMTVYLDGRPTLVQWNGALVEPLGGVDVDDTIGGCAFDGSRVVVAVPGAQRVVALPVALQSLDESAPLPGDPGGPQVWSVEGGPDVLVEGAFGHIREIAVVPSAGGAEIWGGTANRALAEGGGGASDDRVVRLPADGGRGGSPD
ncbi:glucose dehydrogenase [Corynebacterium sp. 335C]